MKKRVPIIRKAIVLSKELKLQLKLQEMQMLDKEEDILAMSYHFDMLVVKRTDKLGYRSLSENHTKHRNWKHFERVWEVCRMKQWNTKLYIEAQFDRCKFWTTGAPYPQPSSMYSVSALRYFLEYTAILDAKHRKDLNYQDRKSGQETKSLKKTVIDDIVASADMLAGYVSKTSDPNLVQYKTLKIYQSWDEFSPYYLYSVPWFREVLATLPDTTNAVKCRKEFEKIDRSKSLQETIKETVAKSEAFFNLPPNMDL